MQKSSNEVTLFERPRNTPPAGWCVMRSVDSMGDPNARMPFSSGHLPCKVRPLHTPHYFYFWGLLISLFCISPLSAQDDPDRRSELGVRQKLVERRMVELENKLTVIADRLRAKEPERADRLVAAYQQSKELLITKKMAEVGELLDKGSFTEADRKLNEVIQSLESLIRILVDQKEKPISKEQEIEMLEKWRESIKERIHEQQQHRKETETISDKDMALDKLEAQIKQLEGLIQKQNEIIQATGDNVNAGLQTLDRIADQQFEVRRATEALNREIGGQKSEDGGQKSEGGGQRSENGGQKSEDGGQRSENGGQKSEDGGQRSEDGGQRSEDGGQRLEDGGQKSEGGGQKSEGGGQKSEGEETSGSNSPQTPNPESQTPNPATPPQPGQQALEQAAANQEKAEERLSSGKAADAKRQEQEALENMKTALNELQKEKRRVESLPPEALEQMSDQQRRTRDKAMDLVEEMKNAPKSPSEENDSNASDSPSQPGQQSMEQAGGSMGKAADNMQQQNPEDAKKDQEQALNEMNQALEEVEDRLNQLREETREEKLARLEARFAEMLERQIVTSIMTVELDDKRTNLGEFKHRDQLLLLQLANDELEISELGQQAYDLLLEDGTSSVFPEMVQELRQELEKVSRLLSDEQTGALTQLVQKEIEYALQDLLDSMKDAQQDSQNEGGGGGGGGGETPLLKKSAELKILRSQQLRLNRRARQIETIRSAEPEMGPQLEQETLDAAALQQKLIQMLEALIEKEGE